MVEADSHLKLLPTSILDICLVFSTLICCPLAYSISLTQLYLPYLAQILGFWVTCEVKMMWLCHGWGWQPPQTAPHIHIKHIQGVWAHWYAVHWHKGSALHSYTHPTFRFWGSGSLVESKWCDCVMVEADGHLKLLPASISAIYKVFGHWYAVYGHMVAVLNIYTHPTWLRFWGSGSLVDSKWYHYVMVHADSHLELLPVSILDINKVFEHIDMLSIGIW